MNEQTDECVQEVLLQRGGGRTDNTGKGSNAQLLCLGFARENHGGRTVVEVGGIGSCDGSIGLEDRSETGNLVILDLFVLFILFDDHLAALSIGDKYRKWKCNSKERTKCIIGGETATHAPFCP